MESSNAGHRKVRKKTGFKIAIAAVLAVAVFLVAAVVYMQTHGSDVIADNIYVNDISVGGLTADAAAQLLDKEITNDYLGKTVEIKYLGEVCKADLLGTISIDSKRTAEEALEKSNTLWERLFDKNKVTIPFELNTDGAELRTIITEFARSIEDKTGVFAFNDDYTSVSVDAGKIDKLLDVDATLALIYDNAANNKFDPVDAVTVGKDSDTFSLQLFERLSRNPKNASVAMNDDNSTYIVAQEYGVTADKDEFERLYKENNGVFTMKITPIEPEITTDDLNIDFYQDVLGTYTSSYNVGLVNRTKNLSLAARLVNGTVIMPGKRFSYNGTVGPRTYARGFVDATVYTGEGTEEGIGGGICQVSSTIYCAQLRADLKTVSRTNHSYTVVYVPLGQDATVVYGALDYVFENDTNYPIKISAVASGGYLTVKILGTRVDNSKSVDVVSVTNSTIAKGETKKEDSSIPQGQTRIKQKGQDGAVVSAYKVYYKDGVEVKREYIGKSTYKPMNRIVLVGTGPAAVSPPASNEKPTEVTPPAETPTEPQEPDAPSTPVTPSEPSEPSHGTDNPQGGDTTEPSEPTDSENGGETQPPLSESGL